MNHDERCRGIIEANPNMLVPWYLIASYGYYIIHYPVLSDELYDEICKKLLDKLYEIEHCHKHLIDMESLDAGTAYHLSDEDYPRRIKGAFHGLASELEDQQKANKKRSKKTVAAGQTSTTKSDVSGFGSLSDLW